MLLLDGNDPAGIQRGAARLAAGELLAFPTETVYGLGARADDDRAVAAIFSAKGRPAGHPLIVHVAEPADADRFAARLAPVARRLIAACWPGPLTLIVERADGIAHAAAAGQRTVGLRCPSHPVARALLHAARRLGVPGVAAPSANRFGRISPTLAAHVVDEFGGGGGDAGDAGGGSAGSEIAVLDGGACQVGIESSIVDCSRGRPVLLRPGVLTLAQIEAAAGEPLGAADASAPRAPGTLLAHYAPAATLRLMSTPQLRTALQLLGEQPLMRLAVYSRTLPLGIAPGVRHRRMPAQAAQAAHELFSVVRELDAEGAQLIWVEEPPAGAEWDGVRDRLRRAAAAS